MIGWRLRRKIATRESLHSFKSVSSDKCQTKKNGLKLCISCPSNRSIWRCFHCIFFMIVKSSEHESSSKPQKMHTKMSRIKRTGRQTEHKKRTIANNKQTNEAETGAIGNNKMEKKENQIDTITAARIIIIMNTKSSIYCANGAVDTATESLWHCFCSFNFGERAPAQYFIQFSMAKHCFHDSIYIFFLLKLFTLRCIVQTK